MKGTNHIAVFGGIFFIFSTRLSAHAFLRGVNLASYGAHTAEEAPSDRIHKGSDADPSSYPFFTQMWWEGTRQGCGASLIASKWVLTAAHCMETAISENSVETVGYPEWRVGAYCYSDDNCGGSTTEIFRSKKAVIHDRFIPSGPRWDYALIELDDASTHTPIHIDDGTISENFQSGDTVRGIGMGYIDNNKTKAERLQEVDNYFLPQERCKLYFTGGSTFDESVMCTGGTNFGMCGGDSGSPTLVRRDDVPHQFVQVSVTSFGAPFCKDHDYPDGSAPTSTVYGWIRETVCPSYMDDQGSRPHYCSDFDYGAATERAPSPAPTSSPTFAPIAAIKPFVGIIADYYSQGDSSSKEEARDGGNSRDGGTEESEVEDACEKQYPRRRFYSSKKEQYYYCNKISSEKKAKKFCKEKKSTALIACPRECGLCGNDGDARR